MRHAPGTQSALDRAPVQSVGLKPIGWDLTIGCCAVSSDPNVMPPIGLGRRKPEPVSGRSRLLNCPLLILSVVGLVLAVQPPLSRAPLPRGPATAGTAVTATAGTATAGTATTMSLSHSTTVASVLTGTSDGRSVTTLLRSPRKRTPVSPLRDNSPKKKKTKPASSSTTSSRKKGGADKASSKDLSQGPATRSGASRKKPSAAAGTAPADTATAGTATAGTAPAASTSASTSGSQALRPKTPTKAALKTYDHSFTLRDPLMPHLEDDPLGGDPFDAFDSGDEEVPCGQRDNLAAMFDLAGTLETPVPAQVGEPRAPPAPPLPLAAQTAPVAGPAPAINLAMLVAALREAVPPPQPQAEVAQSLVAIGQALSALSTKMDTCQVLGKRARSRSPSPPSSPPREKRSRVRSRTRSRSRSCSYSPSPSRSGRSSPTSSQFSDQSEDESPPLGDEETLDLGIPPLNDRSALDHELLTAEGELDRTQVTAPAAAPQPTPGTSRATPSVYTRLGPPTDFMAESAREPPRSWRESWESPDFRFSRPVEFVPVIQALAKILNFKPPTTTSVQEDSQFSVWATASSRTVVVPTPWESDLVIQAATKTDDRRVVKEASSFGDSALAKFLPLSEDDEALLKVLELDNEAIVYMRSTQNPDWDPAKPFGPKVPHATKEAEKFAKVSETSAALTARLGIYLQRTQGFISGAFVEREKERQAWLAGLPPPELPSYITDDTLPGAISLANFLTAAITRVAIRQKLKAGFDRRVRFMAVALSKGVVPHMAKLRLKELPLTKGTLFAGEWTTTVESTTKAQLLSVTQAQLARDQPGAGRASTDRFRIPFKKGKGSGGGQSKKGKKGGGNSSSSSEQSGNKKGAGRGRGKGRGGGTKKDAYSAYNTPKPSTPKPDAE